MRVSDLISTLSPLGVYGNREVEVKRLTYDSRCVEAGSCFFAIRGTQVDGHNFAAAAIAQGAAAIVCESIEETKIDVKSNCEVAIIVVKSTDEAMAAMASRLYRDPSREIKLVGVT